MPHDCMSRRDEGYGPASVEVPAQAPVIPVKLEHAAQLTAQLSELMNRIDVHLDRLIARPPRPVPAGKNVSGNADVAAVLNVDQALSIQVGQLEVLLADARTVLNRLQGAI